MHAVIEVILSLLCVWGLLSLGWLLMGHLLTPVGGCRCCAVVSGRGDGEDLEQAVRGLVWLRGGGLTEGAVVIADCGLSPEGKAEAEALARREPGVALCAASSLGEYITTL